MSRHKECWMAACSVAVSALVLAVILSGSALAQQDEAKDWAMNTTIIEACSCPMFCQCYFNAEPAAHHAHGAEHTSVSSTWPTGSTRDTTEM